MLFGVERLEQIKYAVLERSGGIAIVPKQVGWANPSMYPQSGEPTG